MVLVKAVDVVVGEVVQRGSVVVVVSHLREIRTRRAGGGTAAKATAVNPTGRDVQVEGVTGTGSLLIPRPAAVSVFSEANASPSVG